MSDSKKKDDKKILKVNHPAVIHDPDPSKRDYLDCEVLKTLALDELQKLKAMLAFGSISHLRVNYQIKTLTYSPMAAINIRSCIGILDNAHSNKIAIVNIDMDEIEGRKTVHKFH